MNDEQYFLIRVLWQLQSFDFDKMIHLDRLFWHRAPYKYIQNLREYVQFQSINQWIHIR